MASAASRRTSCHLSPVTCHARRAFTIVELLTVLAIMALLAALAVPALKSIGHADAMTAASAQIMGDAARARQLAISQRTTVYMVFLPANFWNNPFYNAAATYTTWWNNLPAAQRTAVTNLCDKQLTGYALLAYGAVGDQPGNHQWHYLTPWQGLPEGTFIVTNLFDNPYQFCAIATPKQPVSSATIPLLGLWNQDYPHLDRNSIYAFTNVAIPFPVEGAPSLFTALHCFQLPRSVDPAIVDASTVATGRIHPAGARQRDRVGGRRYQGVSAQSAAGD